MGRQAGFCYTPKRAAAGSSEARRPHVRQICIRFDPETFDEVSAMAQDRKCSFQALAMMLIEVGLETLKEDPQ
jgi:predicted HicB family RNase H-like nuclease